MKKISISLLLSFLVLSLGGCEIKFTALTKINPNGSGFRITTYSADDAEKEELLTRYILPDGGNWKSEKYKTKNIFGPLEKHIYEVKRDFKDLNKLAPDYIRKGIRPQNISSNRILLKINKGAVFTTYEYEEIFRDTANERQVREFGERYYNHVLNLASKNIVTALPKLVEENKIKEFLNKTYRPDFDYMLDVFSKSGYKIFLEENNKELKEKGDEFSKKFSEEGFTSIVAGYIVNQNKNVNSEEVQNKLKEVHKKIEEEWASYFENLNKNNFDDALGVYGWAILVSYPFNVSVIMPGRIISANTKDIKLNTAKWIFSPEDFFLKEYKLEAKSRKLNYFAVTVFALCLVAILILANLKSLGKLWK